MTIYPLWFNYPIIIYPYIIFLDELLCDLFSVQIPFSSHELLIRKAIVEIIRIVLHLHNDFNKITFQIKFLLCTLYIKAEWLIGNLSVFYLRFLEIKNIMFLR